MTRETADAKGKRYLVEGRLVVTRVAGDYVAAVCHGDTGGVYELGHTPGRGWWCTCPARTGRCCHLAALWLVTIRRPAPAPATLPATTSASHAA